jgi:DNA-binding response OmpR family regulator
MDGFMTEPTILVVDDEPRISEVATDFLTASGLTVYVTRRRHRARRVSRAGGLVAG